MPRASLRSRHLRHLHQGQKTREMVVHKNDKDDEKGRWADFSINLAKHPEAGSWECQFPRPLASCMSWVSRRTRVAKGSKSNLLRYERFPHQCWQANSWIVQLRTSSVSEEQCLIRGAWASQTNENVLDCRAVFAAQVMRINCREHTNAPEKKPHLWTL